MSYPIKYRAVDFFCGGGGMTYGLRQAGINVIAGVDLDTDAKETYEINNPGTKFINADITKLPLTYFKDNFDIKVNDDNMIFKNICKILFSTKCCIVSLKQFI